MAWKTHKHDGTQWVRVWPVDDYGRVQSAQYGYLVATGQGENWGYATLRQGNATHLYRIEMPPRKVDRVPA